MDDNSPGPVTDQLPHTTREEFLLERRRVGPLRMDQLFAPNYDSHWGAIDLTHTEFLQALIDRTAPNAKLLDAGCGTGKYWPFILQAGRRVSGVDRSSGMLANLRQKFPDAELYQAPLEQISTLFSWANCYDGILCVDTMENVPPEDWPIILAAFSEILRPKSPLYINLEIPGQEDKAASLKPPPPLVPGEVIWPDSTYGGYHYFPEPNQAHHWLQAAGFSLVRSQDGDGMHHMLALSSTGASVANHDLH